MYIPKGTATFSIFKVLHTEVINASTSTFLCASAIREESSPYRKDQGAQCQVPWNEQRPQPWTRTLDPARPKKQERAGNVSCSPYTQTLPRVNKRLQYCCHCVKEKQRPRGTCSIQEERCDPETLCKERELPPPPPKKGTSH